ncbi:hypothetical protein [Longimicrobium sp.]|uniref:hypothetical protein n=1 Tax=Longimicrobium sp. TaxID=2029185 RepID=UPI002E33BE86|nr:hypothetical protein [Longimicrobium sp.]HEX6040328.1 hypothetical protein [Longimicrobium sp.]
MKVLLFGATGMVGQGVLRECLAAPDVTLVQTVGRSATGVRHPKLREVMRPDLTDLAPLADELAGFDACFFCLGVSSFRMAEADYTRLTYDLTLGIAQVLAPLNPAMTFIYVSGTGTDSSEQGRVMWARVKGRTENALRRLPFRAVYLFRPGAIVPMHGERPRAAAYRVLGPLLLPLLPLARRLFPDSVTTTEIMGRAMLNAVRRGAEQPVLEPRDINALANGSA